MQPDESVVELTPFVVCGVGTVTYPDGTVPVDEEPEQ